MGIVHIDEVINTQDGDLAAGLDRCVEIPVCESRATAVLSRAISIYETGERHFDRCDDIANILRRCLQCSPGKQPDMINIPHYKWLELRDTVSHE